METKEQKEFLELLNFSKSFDYEHDNDREVVIVGCAYIESLIKAILGESLAQDKKEINLLLDESSGALSALIPRSRLLYLMGVFPKTVFEDIKLISRIRNHFAHNISASFEDESVVKNVNRMRWHIETLFMEPPVDASVRDIYQVAVNQIVGHLHALPGLARCKRAKGN